MLITLDLPNELKPRIEVLAQQMGKDNAQVLTEILLEQLPKLIATTDVLEPTDDLSQAIWEAENGETIKYSSVTAMIDEIAN